MRADLTGRRPALAARLIVVTAIAAAASITAQFGTPAGAAPAAAPRLSFARATAIRLPANAQLTAGAGLYSVSCPARGACVAGGAYQDKAGAGEAMVVAQAGGKWHAATEIKLPASAAAQPDAEVNGIACPAARDCVAVGYYLDTADHDEGFIATETRGHWARARITPLPRNAGPDGSSLRAVTCTSRRWCQAVGGYDDTSGHDHALAVTDASGHWGSPVALAPPANALPGSAGFAEGIGCTRPGDCFVGGSYYNDPSDTSAYAALGIVESRGHWRRGTEVRLPAGAAAHDADINAVSCTPRGQCTGAGSYDTTSSYSSLTVTESGGKVSRAAQVKATPPDTVGTGLAGISCATARLCAGAGSYGSATAPLLALVMVRSDGRWGHASGVRLPANASKESPRSYLYWVSCAADGYCAAVGYYLDTSGTDIAMASTAS